MAEPRVLTEHELNRTLLTRQLLLERSARSLPRALDALCGIQAQYAPSMYVGLWSRLAGFERDDLTGALGRREVVQGTLVRSTIHLVSREDYWPTAIAVRTARREHWVRVVRPPITDAEMTRAAKRLRERIAGTTMTRAEIDTLLGHHLAMGVGLWLDMIRVPPSGTWERRSANTYAAAEEWLGPEPELDPGDAVEHLIGRYLTGFGPASRKNVASFTGLPPREVNEALGRMRLRRFHDEAGDELLDLSRRPIADPASPAPVRFLPTWDATLLVHARRTQIIPEELRPRIFNTKTPHSVPTFLVDGRVGGTWRFERGKIELQPLHAIPKAAMRELEAEAARAAAFHA